MFSTVALAAVFLACTLTLSTGQSSCKGRCGTEYYRGYMCQCDYTCLSYEECCEDYESQCTTKNSCKGRCGEPFRRGRRCSCDPDCQKFKQCCSDFQTYCDAAEEISGAPSAPEPAKKGTLTDGPGTTPWLSGAKDPGDQLMPLVGPAADPDDLSDELDNRPNIGDPESTPNPGSISGDDLSADLGDQSTDSTQDSNSAEFSRETSTVVPPARSRDEDGGLATPSPTGGQAATDRTGADEPTSSALPQWTVALPSSSPSPSLVPQKEHSSALGVTELGTAEVAVQTVLPDAQSITQAASDGPPLTQTAPSSAASNGPPLTQTAPSSAASDGPPLTQTAPSSAASDGPPLTQTAPSSAASDGPPLTQTAPSSAASDGPPLTQTAPSLAVASASTGATVGFTVALENSEWTGTSAWSTLLPTAATSKDATTGPLLQELLTTLIPASSDAAPGVSGDGVTAGVSQTPGESTSKAQDKPSPTKPASVTQSANADQMSGYQADDSNDMDLCSGRPVSGVTTLRNGTVVVFRGHYFWVLDRNKVPGAAQGITQVWGVPSPIDTVFTRCNCQGKTYIFKGNQYWRFDNGVVDPGYPKAIQVGFGGLRGHITAALSVPQYRQRRESVYFFKRGGVVQKYSYHFTPSPTCGTKPKLNIYTVRNRLARQAAAPNLGPTINIRASWRGFPTAVTAAVSVPNRREPDGYKYYVFSRAAFYNVKMDSERPALAAPAANTSPQNNFFKCPKKI